MKKMMVLLTLILFIAVPVMAAEKSVPYGSAAKEQPSYKTLGKGGQSQYHGEGETQGESSTINRQQVSHQNRTGQTLNKIMKKQNSGSDSIIQNLK